MKKHKNKNKTCLLRSLGIFLIGLILLAGILLGIQYQIQTHSQLNEYEEKYYSEKALSILLSIAHLITEEPLEEETTKERLNTIYPEKIQPALEEHHYIRLLGWREENEIAVFYQEEVAEEDILPILHHDHELYQSLKLPLEEGDIILFLKKTPDTSLVPFLSPLLPLFVLAILFFILLIRKTQLSRSSGTDTKYLIAGLSHELKNPLNAMNLNIQLMEEVLQDSEKVNIQELQGNLELIKKQFQVLSNLLNRFLEYTRTKQLVHTNVNLAKCIEEVFNNIPWTVKNPHVKMDIQTAGKPRLIRSDAQILHQIFQNILLNALEVFPPDYEKARITIKIEFLTKYVKIRFIDNGPGMDQETLDHLGEPFFTNKESGAGLGIPIVFHLVEHLRGKVRIHSQPGEGTEIELTIPYE